MCEYFTMAVAKRAFSAAIVLLAIKVHVGLSQFFECPLVCSCVSVDFLTSCQKALLKELPEGISNQTSLLDLSMNRFEAIPDGLVNLPELQFLNMSRNEITHLNKSALNDLKTLRLLDLSNNLIKSWTSIHPHALMSAPELVELDLSYNFLGNYPAGTANYPIKSLSVKRLHLINCSISNFLGEYLYEMVALEELYMSFNNLMVLHTPFQADKLQILDLTECSLQRIHPNVFSKAYNLTVLILANNFFLKRFASSVPNLKILDLSHCNIESLPSGKMPQLLQLNLAGNHLRHLPANSFKLCPLIQKLDLSNNAIKTIDFNAFYDLEFLQALDMSYNTILYLDYETFNQNKHMRVLNLSRNYIRDIGKLKGPSLKWLDLSVCEIQHIHSDSLIMMPHLQHLNLSRNLITYLPDRVEADNLGVLDLSNCGIFSLNNYTFYAMPRLRVLNLAGNRLTSGIKPEFFHGITDLSLEMNPWYCDCSSADFKELYDWITHRIYTSSVLRCSSPENLAGRTWEHACHEQWMVHTKQVPQHMWIYSTSIVASMFLLCVVVMVLKHINKRKQARQREEEEREREEARDRLRRMQRNSTRSRESVNRNAPDPFQQLPPSYVEAISMPRLNMSCTTLAGSQRSLHSLQSTSSQPETSGRRSKVRRKRRRNKVDLRDGLASETQSAVSLSRVPSDPSSSDEDIRVLAHQRTVTESNF